MTYCYTCIRILQNGGSWSYSYKNSLNATITGSITNLLSVNLVTDFLGIGTNKEFSYTDGSGNPIGVNDEVNVDGMSLCRYHCPSGLNAGD